MSVSYLQKSSNSNNPVSNKYHIKCTESSILENWLNIMDDLKSIGFADENRAIFGTIINHSDFVIKIANSNTLLHDHYIAGILETNRVPGFIRYMDLQEENGVKIILMSYYADGNLKKYKWGPENYHVLKSSILQVVLSLMQAYQAAHITHNDIHLQNILLVPTTKKSVTYTVDNVDIEIPTYGMKILIMDFENALYSRGNWDGLLRDIGKLLASYILEIDEIEVADGFQLLAEIDFNEKNLTKLYKSIEKMVYGTTLVRKEKPSSVHDPYNVHST
jgi:hypothetical protein